MINDVIGKFAIAASFRVEAKRERGWYLLVFHTRMYLYRLAMFLPILVYLASLSVYYGGTEG